mgnify:CR=1 FL=1
MKKIKISVIVPVYNAEKYLSDCIDSILNQTLKEFELILINDGSTDNSLQICREKAAKDSRIKIINKKNEGQGYARNIGIDSAKGEFITFVDSDDYIDNEAYEKMYELCKKYHADYCVTPFSIKSNIKKDEIKIYEGREIKNKILIDLLGNYPQNSIGSVIGPSVCTKLFNSKIIKDNKIKFISERQYSSEDNIFNINYILFSNKVVMYNKNFYHYRNVDNSFSHRYRDEYLKKINNMYIYIRDNLFQGKMNDREKLCLNNNIMCQYIVCITQEVTITKQTNIITKLKRIKKICNNDIVQEVSKQCNPNLYSFKKRIFFKAMKSKQYIKLYIYVKLRNLKKEERNEL